MKLSELHTLNLNAIEKKKGFDKPQLMQLDTAKKGNKAEKEFIKYCNRLGYCPINPHKRWNKEKKKTEVIAYAVYFGIKNAKKVKVIEKDN